MKINLSGPVWSLDEIIALLGWMTFLLLVCAAIFVIALLYSSVGHAGASGYIAVLTLFSFAPSVIKPTVLLLNILVASIATYQFWRAGHFSWRLFLPFAVLSVPCAFLGGYLLIPAHTFKLIVGIVLLISAVRLFWANKLADTKPANPAPLTISLPVGAAIGFLSGITSTGGGIFLTPLLLFFRWAKTKPAAATSALFVLVNSMCRFARISQQPPASASSGMAFGGSCNPRRRYRLANGKSPFAESHHSYLPRLRPNYCRLEIDSHLKLTR